MNPHTVSRSQQRHVRIAQFAADHLVTPNTVRNWIKAGRIPVPHKIGVRTQGWYWGEISPIYTHGLREKGYYLIEGEAK